MFQTTPPRQIIQLSWSPKSPLSPVSKRLCRRREIKDTSILCPFEQVESSLQSFASDCLSLDTLHNEEKKCQSSDYQRSASPGMFNDISIE